MKVTYIIIHDVENIVWHSVCCRTIQNNNGTEIVKKCWLTEEYLQPYLLMTHIKNLWDSIHIMYKWTTHSDTHALSHKHYIIFIYCLRFPPPCVVFHVLLDLGKFIRKWQQTAALIVFSAHKMRFPMKQVPACMWKEMLNLNPSLSKLELCYGLHGNWSSKISVFQNLIS